MGMRWRAVLVKATNDEAREIAVAAQKLIPNLTNQIDASVVSLRSPAVPSPWVSMRMFNFISREPGCSSAPACIREAFSGNAFHAQPASEVLKEIATDPHVALAILASRIRGEATFVICSDTLCCSGHLRFANGTFVSGEVFGWEGNDTLWSLSPNGLRSQQIDLSDADEYNYYKPVADGLIATIGPGADELFLSPEGDGTDGDWFRFHILTNRQPISPVVAKAENAERNRGAAPPIAVDSPNSSDRVAKRPWWKFW